MYDVEHFGVGYDSWCVISKPENVNYLNGNEDETFESGDGMERSMALNGLMLPVISGNISRTLSVPALNSYFLPDQLYTGGLNGEVKHKEVKSQIRAGFGTYTFQGSMDFEMTNKMTDLLDVNDDLEGEYGMFFRRNSIFHLQFYDGKRTCTARNCVWSDFSISGSPNSAVRSSLNFQSNNGYKDDLDVKNGNLNAGAVFDSDDFLLPYWRCGTGGILEFSLSISRPVTPVFLNNTLRVPSYLRVGMASVSLQMTCMSPKSWDSSIYIGGKKITFNSSILQSYDYQMTTLSDVGNKSYTWTSINLDDLQPVFRIDMAEDEHQEPELRP